MYSDIQKCAVQLTLTRPPSIPSLLWCHRRSDHCFGCSRMSGKDITIARGVVRASFPEIRADSADSAASHSALSLSLMK